MKTWIAVIYAVGIGLAGANQALAQDSVPGPGTVVVTVIPGGATFFTEGKNTKGPSFGSYSLGAGVEFNFNRYIGVEGEVSGGLGVTQNLQFTGGTLNAKTPDLINYSGNLVVSVPTGRSVVPYATGGVGGLTYLEKAGVQVNDAGTFLTGNVGGGVKWFSGSGRWGVRGDYRFIVTKSKDDAPAFFGQETRYGHRVYGGLLINAGR